MDLSKLAVAATSQFIARHPVSEDELDITIDFYGPTSDTVRKLRHAKTQAALNRMAKGKKAGALKADELEAESITDTFKRAVGWSGVELKGKALDFTEENWSMVMTSYPWLFSQVTDFLSDDGSFLG